jgi:hypothetical protein
MLTSRLTAVAVATLAAACACAALASPAGAARTSGCAITGYSYGGVQTLGPRRGISARITATRISAVTSGHIAGWVGVGGAGQGAHGADEWIQIGISSFPGGETEIYYEVAQAGRRAAYTAVAPIAAGESRVLGVYEIAPTIWVATVDGLPVTKPVMLPGSHNTWHGMATAESYDGGITACNTYGIQFADLRVADFTGLWFPIQRPQAFSDGGHALTTFASSSFVVNRR